MIPDFFNSKYEMPEALNSNEIGIAFDDLIAMAIAFEKANSTHGQYSTAEADSDKLKNLPGASGVENKSKNDNDWEDKTELAVLPLELKMYPNHLELNFNNLTLGLKPNDHIHYIFVIDTLGEIWYEKMVEQFQQILKIDTDLFPNGIYNILIENEGSFLAKRFIISK